MAVDPPIPLAQPPLASEDGDGTSLHEYIGTLLASRGLIFFITLAVLVGGFLFDRLVIPVYRSDTLIQVEEKKRGMPGLEDMVGMFPGDSVADTEIEILRSRSLVGGVVRSLSLDVEAVPRHF